MRNDSSVDDLGEDPELFSPSKEQKYDIEEYLKKRKVNPLEEWRQKTHQNGKVPLYLRSGVKKPQPERITAYYNLEAAKKIALDKQMTPKTVFGLSD